MLSTKSKIQLASISSNLICSWRDFFNLKNKAVFFRKGINWELDLTDGIDFAIFLQGAFEHSTLSLYSKVIKPGFTILDIGANIGAHTLHFARFTGEKGKVYAFEPTDYAFNKLSKNVSLNPTLSKQISLYQALLINELDESAPTAIPSRWPLNANKDEASHPVHLGVFESLNNAKKIRLDDWFSNMNKPKIDLIKIDVDGFEIDVLKGAKNLLNEQKPPMVMEFAPYIFEERGYHFTDLIQLLSKHHYNCFLPNGKPIPLNEDLINIIPKGGSINVLLK
jgi:FkbM family methyltransferase